MLVDVIKNRITEGVVARNAVTKSKTKVVLVTMIHFRCVTLTLTNLWQTFGMSTTGWVLEGKRDSLNSLVLKTLRS